MRKTHKRSAWEIMKIFHKYYKYISKYFTKYFTHILLIRVIPIVPIVTMEYLAICLDIRISRPSYLAATCPSDRGRSYPAQVYPHSESNHNLNLRVDTEPQAKHFNSLARDRIVGQRSCPCAPQDARAHAECERYYQFDSI